MRLSSLLALLGIADLAFCASPAAATYCAEDNLLRAFQHTPTPASKYCITATGKPTFVAATTYPASRLSSACSCFSRFPTDYTLPTKAPAAPACIPNFYHLDAFDPGNPSDTISLTLQVDPAQGCNNGFTVINACGTFLRAPVFLDASNGLGQADYCFAFGDSDPLDSGGVGLWWQGQPIDIWDGGAPSAFYVNGDLYSGTFTCATSAC